MNQECANLWNNRNKFDYNIDGLIFTPRFEKYHNVTVKKLFRWENNFKWKPVEYSSIDFLIKFKKENGKPVRHVNRIYNPDGSSVYEYYKIVYLYVGSNIGGGNMKNRYQEVLFEQTQGKEFRNIPCYIAKLKESQDREVYTQDPISNEREIIYDSSIVEFTYDKKKTFGFEWIPIRNRYDKTESYRKNRSISHTANDIKIATQTWNSYHEGDGFLLQNNLFH